MRIVAPVVAAREAPHDPEAAFLPELAPAPMPAPMPVASAAALNDAPLVMEPVILRPVAAPPPALVAAAEDAFSSAVFSAPRMAAPASSRAPARSPEDPTRFVDPDADNADDAEDAPPAAAVRGQGRTSAGQRVRVDVDPDRQQIQFRLTYTGAIVAGFAVFVGVGMAYLVGRHSIGGPVPLLADRTTQQIRSGATQADVLNVGPGSKDDGGSAAAQPRANVSVQTKVEAAPPAGGGSTTPARPGAKPAAPPARPGFNEPKPPETFVASDSKRIVGLNYVVIQSYPDLDMAEDARDLLIKSGILCTVEWKLPGWGSKWYSVVGIKGFDKVRSSKEYADYTRRIEDISDQFAGNSKFKRFQPQAFQWKGNGTLPPGSRGAE